jgi:uncharacterized membrane protein YfcA
VGGYLGGLLANKLETQLIKKIFAVFLILVALKMLFLDKPKAPAGSNQKSVVADTPPTADNSEFRPGE